MCPVTIDQYAPLSALLILYLTIFCYYVTPEYPSYIDLLLGRRRPR